MAFPGRTHACGLALDMAGAAFRWWAALLIRTADCIIEHLTQPICFFEEVVAESDVVPHVPVDPVRHPGHGTEPLVQSP